MCVEEDIRVKRRRHTPKQIVRLLGGGQTIAEAAKQLDVSEQTYHGSSDDMASAGRSLQSPCRRERTTT